MSSLEADQAFREFDIPEAAHSQVLQEASKGRPWNPEALSTPGVEIDEDVYSEGILEIDPREKQDRHDLLIDGRLERFRRNLEKGKQKWDLVLTERDFYSHPSTMESYDGLSHERQPETHLKMGDGDLIFLDLDRYEAHMVEVKPHEGYDSRGLTQEYLDTSQGVYGRSETSDSSYGNAVTKKTRNWREAWESVVDELEQDWSVYEPEFVFGSEVLEEDLSENTEYALPLSYSQAGGYAMGADEGFAKAASSDDMETLNEVFFRGGVDELVDGERPEMDGEKVF